jgi:hypothetical protein
MQIGKFGLDLGELPRPQSPGRSPLVSEPLRSWPSS